MPSRSRIFYFAAGFFLILYVITSATSRHDVAGWMLTLFFSLIALAFREHPILKGYSFTVMIFAAVSAAMYHPQYFIQVGSFKLSKLIVPLMQIIMFGMGTGLSIGDFSRVARMPKGVVLGVCCQYLIMPFVGLLLTKIFNFPNEVAAGIILIGCCPSGLASNVMTYLARANLALSVTITAIATLMAPLVTPFLMSQLAGQYVEIHFWAMVWDITKIVIIPVSAGLLFNYVLHGKFKQLDAIMPIISMAGIVLIIVVITSAGRNDLLVVGPKLIMVVILHNSTGYFLGYWSARLLRMDERDSRTIAIEVGLQNAGLGSSLALAMGKLSTVGLAAAIFAPVMNITGSSLALWWRGRPIKDTTEYDQAEPIKLKTDR